MLLSLILLAEQPLSNYHVKDNVFQLLRRTYELRSLIECLPATYVNKI